MLVVAIGDDDHVYDERLQMRLGTHTRSKKKGSAFDISVVVTDDDDDDIINKMNTINAL